MMAHPAKILIVEDEALIALSIQWELEAAGYEVCGILATGEEAVTRVFQDCPDLVLMDANLVGKIDGVEAVRLIRAASGVPVIFITGYAERDIRQRTQGLDSLGYLVKPINMHYLQQLIDTLVG